eukprot:scaffold290837_cov28-Tisochrysis_lutea.AAC.1
MQAAMLPCTCNFTSVPIAIATATDNFRQHRLHLHTSPDREGLRREGMETYNLRLRAPAA